MGRFVIMDALSTISCFCALLPTYFSSFIIFFSGLSHAAVICSYSQQVYTSKYVFYSTYRTYWSRLWTGYLVYNFQLAKLRFNHPSVVLTADVFKYWNITSILKSSPASIYDTPFAERWKKAHIHARGKPKLRHCTDEWGTYRPTAFLLARSKNSHLTFGTPGNWYFSSLWS